MNKKLTFPELAELLSVATDTSKRMSELFLRELFSVIAQSLIGGESVKIKNLGVFKIGEVSARRSIDVNTGKAIEIPGHKKITFTPDKSLAEAVNASFSSFEAVILDDDVTTEMFAEIDSTSIQNVTLPKAEVAPQVAVEIPEIAMPEEAENAEHVAAEGEEEKVPSIVLGAIADIAKELAAVNGETLAEASEGELDDVLKEALGVAAQADYFNQFMAEESENKEPETVAETAVEESETAVAEATIEEAVVEETAPAVEPEAETVEECVETVEEHESATEENETVSYRIVEERVAEVSAAEAEEPVAEIAENLQEQTQETVEVTADEAAEEPAAEVEEKAEEPVAEEQGGEDAEKKLIDEHRKELNERYDRVKKRSRDNDEDEGRSWLRRNKLGVGFAAGVMVGALVILGGFWYLNTSNVVNYSEPEVVVENVGDSKTDETDTVIEATVVETPVEPVKIVTDTVRKNNYLARMADKFYGDAHYWVYIYEENKAIIKNPNRVSPGTVVVIPPAEKYGIDKNDPNSLEEADRRAKEVLSAFK